MSEKEIGSIPQIVRELFGHLPKDMDDKLKGLVDQAEGGHDTTVEIVNLFAKHEHTRQWLKENIKLLGGEKGTPRIEHGSLAGTVGWIPPTQKWICPINPIEHWLMVIQEGEEAPICPKCKKDNSDEEMIRERKKKG
jgi:hypothetical protein